MCIHIMYGSKLVGKHKKSESGAVNESLRVWGATQGYGVRVSAEMEGKQGQISHSCMCFQAEQLMLSFDCMWTIRTAVFMSTWPVLLLWRRYMGN